MEESKPDCWFVLTGISGSRRDQPSEFMDSRNEADAIVLSVVAVVAWSPWYDVLLALVCDRPWSAIERWFGRVWRRLRTYGAPYAAR